MLTILDYQIAALRDQAVLQFQQRLSLICNSLERTVSGQSPVGCDAQTISRYVDHAQRFGCMIERDIARFVVLCVYFEGRLPIDSKVRAALLNSTIDPATRIARLYEISLATLSNPSTSPIKGNF